MFLVQTREIIIKGVMVELERTPIGIFFKESGFHHHHHHHHQYHKKT